MTTVSDWTAGFLTGLTAGLSRLFSAIPSVIGALLVLIIGWFISGIIGGLVTRLCRAIRADTVADRIGVNAFLARSGTKRTASTLLGDVVKWVIRLAFIEMAAEQLGMPQITNLINQMLAFIPNIIVAVAILAVGAFLGQLLRGLVQGSAGEAGLSNAGLLGRLTYIAIMAFAVIAALNELNVAPVVVDTLYIGLVAAIALAVGLAFGLGGRDTAARLTEHWVSRAQAMSDRLSTASTTSAIVRSTTEGTIT